MSQHESEAEPDEEGGVDSGDELVGLVTLQDNDSDTIKHSQDGYFEKREG